MADNRDELIRMLAELEDASEDEVAQLLVGIAEESDGREGSSEAAAVFAKMIAEDKEKKKRGAEKVCKVIKTFFAEKEWKYSEVMQSKYPLYVLNFKMKNLNVSLRVIVETDQECIRFDTVLPASSKSQNYIILSYKLTEINMPLRYGSFHVDSDDNEISYRYSLPYVPEAFEGKLCGRIIQAIVRTVDEYYETVISYAQGTISEDEKNKVLKSIQKNVEYLKNNL